MQVATSLSQAPPLYVVTDNNTSKLDWIFKGRSSKVETSELSFSEYLGTFGGYFDE